MPRRQPADPRRRSRHFPSANARPFQREREKNVGVAQDIVIKKVLRGRAEITYVERPARDRDAKSEFALFIALTVQGCELAVECSALFKQRPRYGKKRRGSVITSP